MYISIILHSLIATLLVASAVYPTPMENAPTEIEVVAHKIRRQGSKSSAKSNTEPLHLSNNGVLPPLELSEGLSANNYIERIKELIEPGWRHQVKKRLDTLHRSNRRIPKCSSCIQSTINTTGVIINSQLTVSCLEDAYLDPIALNAFDRALPPPPSNLMRQNLLSLDWCFQIR